jgi:hypothetical protein
MGAVIGRQVLPLFLRCALMSGLAHLVSRQHPWLPSVTEPSWMLAVSTAQTPVMNMDGQPDMNK